MTHLNDEFERKRAIHYFYLNIYLLIYQIFGPTFYSNLQTIITAFVILSLYILIQYYSLCIKSVYLTSMEAH